MSSKTNFNETWSKLISKFVFFIFIFNKSRQRLEGKFTVVKIIRLTHPKLETYLHTYPLPPSQLCVFFSFRWERLVFVAYDERQHFRLILCYKLNHISKQRFLEIFTEIRKFRINLTSLLCLVRIVWSPSLEIQVLGI